MGVQTQRIKHAIRAAYGYTDDQILDHIGKYGIEWATHAYEFIMEDEERKWQLLIAAMPVARSPMSKKGGKSLSDYTKKLRRHITDYLTPWIKQRRIAEMKERLRRPPQSKMYDENGREVDPNSDWWKKEV